MQQVWQNNTEKHAMKRWDNMKKLKVEFKQLHNNEFSKAQTHAREKLAEVQNYPNNYIDSSIHEQGHQDLDDINPWRRSNGSIRN